LLPLVSPIWRCSFPLLFLIPVACWGTTGALGADSWWTWRVFSMRSHWIEHTLKNSSKIVFYIFVDIYVKSY
jgi:hypothetical protein